MDTSIEEKSLIGNSENEDRSLLHGELNLLKQELDGFVTLQNDVNNAEKIAKKVHKKKSVLAKKEKIAMNPPMTTRSAGDLSARGRAPVRYDSDEGEKLGPPVTFGRLTQEVLAKVRAKSQQSPSMARLAASRKLAEWPQPFPGYKGLFSYEVAESLRESDSKLGNGVYLWTLEIIAGSVLLGEPDLTANTMPFECVMRKTLNSLPEDACKDMKEQQGRYILERWSGEAELHCKLFKLANILGDEPVHTNINFENIPLTREVLAGQYEFQLSEDDSIIKAIHTSWVEFAKLDPESAAGFLYRVEGGSAVCPYLRPPSRQNLDKKLLEAIDHLHGATVWKRSDPHRVSYKPVLFRILEIGTTTGTFSAELEVAMEYLVSREDVFHYIIRPEGWRPTWMPNHFEVMNALDRDSVITHVYPPSFKVKEGVEREIHAMICVNYRGTFTENFELHSFPFDVQGLHVKLHVEQDKDVEMIDERLTKNACRDHHMSSILSKDWMITEWRFLDLRSRSAEVKMGSHNNHAARMFVICRVQRYARSYLIRIMGVSVLICLLSNTIFVIDPADALGEMVGHSFMMLLTLTTYSLVVADILPVLGYLTLLDKFVLVAFVFLAVVVMEVAFIGKLPDLQAESEVVIWWCHIFAVTNISSIIGFALFATLYVMQVMIPRELRKPVEDPGLDLKQSMRVFQRTAGLESASKIT